MNVEKRKRLEEAGFRAGTVADLLGLTPEESKLIEILLALTHAFQRQRAASGLSQSQLAEKIGSSQARVAKMEAGDPHASRDLMMKALVASGMTQAELAAVLAA